MTESNGITTLNSATSYLAKPTSCGRAVLNVQLRIVNDDDVEVPIGTAGEVLIRGPTVMKGRRGLGGVRAGQSAGCGRCAGYWNKPKESAEVLLKDAEGQLW
jgi:acyl-CoA synthetase (AMP-forming)/AMP-acid ligase II